MTQTLLINFELHKGHQLNVSTLMLREMSMKFKDPLKRLRVG